MKRLHMKIEYRNMWELKKREVGRFKVVPLSVYPAKYHYTASWKIGNSLYSGV